MIPQLPLFLNLPFLYPYTGFDPQKWSTSALHRLAYFLKLVNLYNFPKHKFLWIIFEVTHRKLLLSFLNFVFIHVFLAERQPRNYLNSYLTITNNISHSVLPSSAWRVLDSFSCFLNHLSWKTDIPICFLIGGCHYKFWVCTYLEKLNEFYFWFSWFCKFRFLYLLWKFLNE